MFSSGYSEANFAFSVLNDAAFELDRGEILFDGTVDIAADAKRLQEFKVGGLVIEDVKDWSWEIMTGSAWNCDINQSAESAEY